MKFKVVAFQETSAFEVSRSMVENVTRIKNNLTAHQRGLHQLLEQNEHHRGTNTGLQLLSRAYQRLGLTLDDMDRAEEDLKKRVVDLDRGDL